MWLKVISLGQFSKRCSTVSSLMPFFSPPLHVMLLCGRERRNTCHCEFKIITLCTPADLCPLVNTFRHIFHTFRDMHVRVRQQETVDEPGHQVHRDRDVLDLDRSHRQFCIRAGRPLSIVCIRWANRSPSPRLEPSGAFALSLSLSRAITQRP